MQTRLSGIKVNSVILPAEDYLLDASENPYRTLGIHLRHLIKLELSSGKYPCLKNPDNKSCSSKPICQQQFRFCIVPRPKVDAGNGERNLDIGKLENLFCVSGAFKGESVLSGFETPGKNSVQHPYRLCLGCFPSLYLSTSPNSKSLKKLYALHAQFAGDMQYCFSLTWPSLREQLFDGDYEGVVKTSLPIVEYCLESLQNNAVHAGL